MVIIAVALLPIAWVYSLLPLLSVIMQKWTHPLIIIVIILTLFMPPFGPISAVVMLFCVPFVWRRYAPTSPGILVLRYLFK